MNRGLAVLGAMLSVFTSRVGTAVTVPEAGVVRIEPKETDELFASPGMGWQTFNRFADEDKNLSGLPSSSAYFRFYWREIEPKENQIDFARLDSLLAHARRAGQKLALRVMCTGSGEYMDVPAWLKEQGCRGFDFTYGGAKHWVPDFSDERFRATHCRLIQTLGHRYDEHPDFDLLDIGSVGLWGEWHMSGTSRIDTGAPVDLPEPTLRLAIIDEWCRAFPNSLKVVLIGSEEGMSVAGAKGCGWRADCLGDMGGFSKTWNHMDNFYLQQLERTHAQHVWKTGPVAFESCWDMRKWKDSGWNVSDIFDYALRCHATYMNNKSAPIPQGTRGEIERFLRRLGYRLVIRSVEHNAVVRPGDKLRVSIEWENVGVAPPYRDYFVALSLRSKVEQGFKPVLTESGESIRGWLPGRRNTILTFAVPKGFAFGQYDLGIGIIGRNSQSTVVRLANVGPAPGGWYSVSQITVVPE